ncbi:alkyl sulfatase dimerization domain-containing protein [Bacteroides uniformis]|uniref:alkyl/aryl-sulfatase n=1 Tax=Bacteroides uniformis TaxID=820 RepID=UPI0039B663A1
MKEEQKQQQQPSPEKYEAEMQNALRGYISGTALSDPIAGPKIPGPGGQETETVAWDIGSYSFLDKLKYKENPDESNPDTCNTIHANLLRQEQMNNVNGLFMVCFGADGSAFPPLGEEMTPGDGKTPPLSEARILQLRSYDLATMSFVRSDSGWIVIDPLGGKENVRAGLEQFRTLFPRGEDGTGNRIVAVLVTHSHVDHYRGIDALTDEGGTLLAGPGTVTVTPADKDENKEGDCDTISCPVAGRIVYLAPAGFYDEAVSENLYLGNSMTRRSAYMYGRLLPHDVKHHVGSGLGKTVGTASGSLRRPSMEIDFPDGDLRTLRIDGLTVSFLDAHDSEAPSECHIYFHDYRALCPGENVTHTMHNLLTCRGAKIRNPKAFARAIDRSLREWGTDVQTIIGTHHWPVWGGDQCREIMTKQRDMYLFFNDQVIHRINRGMNMEEIAESFRLPDSLASECYNRGYYGSVNHNVKAVFQYYVGWWDGNPANYYRYPEREAARRFVDCMGGMENVLTKAVEYFDKELPDYRWVIELTKQVLFYPDAATKQKEYFEQARELAAKAMTKLAYGFEAGTWRNIFLTGAQELRGGTAASSLMSVRIDNSAAQIAGLDPERAFEYLSVLVNADKVEELMPEEDPTSDAPVVELHLGIGADHCYRLYIANGVLHSEAVPPSASCEMSCIEYADMQEFASAYNASMKRMHPDDDNTPAPEPLDAFDTLCQCLELPPDNWQIVFPLDVPNNAPKKEPKNEPDNDSNPLNEQPCVE